MKFHKSAFVYTGNCVDFLNPSSSGNEISWPKDTIVMTTKKKPVIILFLIFFGLLIHTKLKQENLKEHSPVWTHQRFFPVY